MNLVSVNLVHIPGNEENFTHPPASSSTLQQLKSFLEPPNMENWMPPPGMTPPAMAPPAMSRSGMPPGEAPPRSAMRHSPAPLHEFRSTSLSSFPSRSPTPLGSFDSDVPFHDMQHEHHEGRPGECCPTPEPEPEPMPCPSVIFKAPRTMTPPAVGEPVIGCMGSRAVPIMSDASPPLIWESSTHRERLIPVGSATLEMWTGPAVCESEHRMPPPTASQPARAADDANSTLTSLIHDVADFQARLWKLRTTVASQEEDMEALRAQNAELEARLHQADARLQHSTEAKSPQSATAPQSRADCISSLVDINVQLDNGEEGLWTLHRSLRRLGIQSCEDPILRDMLDSTSFKIERMRKLIDEKMM